MTDKGQVRRLVNRLLRTRESPEEVCASCPQFLPQVRAQWRRLRRLQADLDALFPPTPGQAAGPPVEAALPSISGYEVQEELGRGGMGVVYRARQLRLNRFVALKMLLAGSHAGPEDRERFLREAQAVAGLRHSNIVQVYDVGEADGRPYFTMELVEGGTLADDIHGAPQPPGRAATLVATLADAVQAAHDSGILHRDLKPGNVLLTEDGTPKVGDFGLARRLGNGGGLTVSGTALGTPSYMAPEQARADKAALGSATDVYALGAILYELLTGRPPFKAETSAATLQQVLADEPVSLVRLNPQVPRDLATICLKCLQKQPAKRYASAAALAEDVRRFLRGEPIAARPTGRLERLARWARRRPAAATLLIGAMLVAAIVIGGASWLVGQWVVTARAVEADLREAEQWQQQSDFLRAGAVLERTWSRLGDGGPPWLYAVVETARRDQQFLERLQTVRLNRSTLAEGQHSHRALLRFNNARADRDYAGAFRDQGLGEPPDDPGRVAARVQASRWASHIVAALDDWAVSAADPARQDWLLEVAHRSDPDPWRDRVRDPAAWRDGKALAELTQAVPLAEQPVPFLLALGERLSATGEDDLGFLRRVREQFPDDFWANLTLALALHGAGRRPGVDPGPALKYYDKALEIRPQTGAVLNNLGLAHAEKFAIWEAATILHQLVKNDPRCAAGLNNLGVALQRKGYWPLAELRYQDALEVDPQLAAARCNLGAVRAGSGNLDEAIGHYREALRSDPDCSRAHHLLGVALLAQGRFEEADDDYPESVKPLNRFRGPALNEALANYTRALDCDPQWAPARNPLRVPSRDEARLKEAIDHFRDAVRLEPPLGRVHGALGQALLARHELAEAEAETRRGLELLFEQDKELRANLERQLQRCRRLRALEGRLPALVRYTDRPAAADCLELAELCFVRKHYATAARLYAEALTATPRLTEDLPAGRRLNAARAAALAAGGHGDDTAGLTESQRAGLRRQACEWLRLDLAAWARKIDAGTAADHIQARRTLSPWRVDPDLAELRDTDALQDLPPAERQECRALWQEVEALLRHAQTAQ